MKTTTSKNAKKRAANLPKDMEYQSNKELESIENGETIISRQIRPAWTSFAELGKADDDFMVERQDVIADEGRFNFE